MKSSPAFVKTCLPVLALALAAGWPGPAHASRLDGRIEEVVAGAFGRPEIQYVELTTDTCFAQPWAGAARLAFYDAADQEVGEFVFPAEPPQSCNGMISVLVGTPAFAALASAPDPDFLMAPLLVPGSGKVCFEVPEDGTAECLTYGGFTGVTHQQSPFNAPALSAGGTCALRIANPELVTFQPFNADYDLLPPEPRNSAGQTGVLTVPPRFADVSAASPFLPFVEAMFNAGVTGGCGSGSFCPGALVTRDQMAVFLLRAKEGPAFQPPACAAPVFADVPCSHPFARWINELAARGVTGGCGGGSYCPGAAVDRAQMAVFLLLMAEGPGFQPPACASPVFADVPCSDPFAPWINELAARGITGGCGNDNYCPGGLVNREQMAVFLSTTFDLPVPSRACILPPEVDDHGDTPAEATPVVPLAAAPGLQVAGSLERPRDVDVLSFTAAQGDQFTLTLALQPSEAPEVVMEVSSAAGLHARFWSSNTEAEVGGFTAPHSGTFFITLRDQTGRRIGGYQLFLRGPVPDDHPDGPAGATPLTPGGPSAGGEIEVPGDADVFSFPATAGEVYVVETIGDDPAMKTLLRVTRADHVVVAVNGLASGPKAQASFRAPTTGTFFVLVTHSFQEVGTYELRVRGPIADDHGGTPATATPLAPGTPQDGELLLIDDVDAFSFPAAAGDAFRVRVEPRSGLFPGLRIVDSGGAVLATGSVDFDGNLEILFIAPQTGTFYAQIWTGSTFGLPLSYTLSLEGPLPDDHGDFPATATPLTPGSAAAPFTPGAHEFVGDVDVFSFPVLAGQIFFVEAESADPSFVPFTRVFEADGTELISGDDQRLVVTAPEGGTLFVSVESSFGGTGLYRIRVRGPIVDDHGGRPSQSTPLTPNAPPLLAELELGSDVDLFSFEALAGETFVVKTEGTTSGVFSFGVGLELLDVDGLTVLRTGGFFSFINQILFQAPRTGRFYVRVFGSPTFYRISLAGPFPDDHGDTAATATLLTLDGPLVAGVIESVEDLDAFAFDAVAGETVTVETAGLGQGMDTLLTLESPAGTVLASDDDGGTDLGSRVTFTVPATGRYVAKVTSFPGTVGTYHISARR